MILKAMKVSERDYPTPVHPLGQVAADGVWYDRVAHLPSLSTPDVREWVARHTDDRVGVGVVVALSRGIDVGQVGDPTDVLTIIPPREDVVAIRQAARDELRERLEPLGVRVDHLGGPRHIGMKSDQVRTNWRDVLDFVRSGGTVIVQHYNRPIARITPLETPMAYTLTIVRGEQPNANGEEFGLAGINVNDETYAWFEANGVVESDPDVWVLVTPADEYAGELANVIAQRDVTVPA
jgi:antitoxin (DNA-binding transcriptional repressor) of toxin-antitoxin stability system